MAKFIKVTNAEKELNGIPICINVDKIVSFIAMGMGCAIQVQENVLIVKQSFRDVMEMIVDVQISDDFIQES
jgi:hypothetical protein